MFVCIAIGCGIMILTTFIHAAAMIIVVRLFGFASTHHRSKRAWWIRPTEVAIGVLIMFVAAVVEAIVWAVVYVMLGAIEDGEKALYFSMVTYTTLGYGDVVMDESWRLLSSFEAANGIIMFGWTTAIIVAAVHRLYTVRLENTERHAQAG